MDKIYLVTTLARYVPSRCVGWFPSVGDAVDVVMYNRGDIEEDHYYQYAVIEAQGPGLYGQSNHVEDNLWFEFCVEAGVVVAKKIECPEFYTGLCNFGLG